MSTIVKRTAWRLLAQNTNGAAFNVLGVVQANPRRAAVPTLATVRRWNADAAKEQTSETAANTTVAALQKQIAEQTKLADDYKDKYLRALAEAKNLDSRRNREVTEARQHALFKFGGDLVGSLDMLLLAQRNVPGTIADPSHSDHSYYTGVSMVYSNLLKTLRQHNVTPIEIKSGETEFNAHVHDCVAHVPHPTIPNNRIIEEHRPGWKLNDRVLRAATVVVSSGAPPGGEKK